MEPGEVRITVKAEHARRIRQVIRDIERGEYPRPEIMEFAEAMERTMRRHDPEKGDSYKVCSFAWLFEKLKEEVGELDVEMEEWLLRWGSRPPHDELVAENVDIGLMAMMLHHRARMMRGEVAE